MLNTLSKVSTFMLFMLLGKYYNSFQHHKNQQDNKKDATAWKGNLIHHLELMVQKKGIK